MALGVPITDVHESPVCYSAFVTDPEGNRFGIHQRKNG
jgi:predicted enzyme related to lactoylglutathione lyase